MFNKIPKALRLFFFFLACVIFLGIYLTGFKIVHWFLYIPVAFILVASIFGLCPGFFFSKKIVGDK